MKPKNSNFDQFFDFINFCRSNRFQFDPSLTEASSGSIGFYKGGSKIKIKKKNRGKFTEYCGGNVTSECISRGKNSSDPKIRKRATFAANARKWKHQEGGRVILRNDRQTDFSHLFNN